MNTCWRCDTEIEDGTTCDTCRDDFGTMPSESELEMMEEENE